MRLPLPLILPAGALVLGAGLWLWSATTGADTVTVTTGDGAVRAAHAPGAGDGEPDLAGADATRGPRSPYDLVPGQRMRFAIEATVVQGTRSTLEDEHQEVRLHLGGELVVEVLAREDDAFVLALSGSFPKAGMRIGAEPQAEPAAFLAKALAEPSLLRMATDGRPLGLRFPDGLEAEQQNLIRDLVHRLRFVVAEGTEWNAVEADNSVEARYSYRWDPAPATDRAGVLRKQPLEVLQAPSEEFEARISGDAEAVFDARTGWFSACRVRGSLVLGSESLPFELSYRHELTLHCKGIAFSSSRGIAVEDGPWDSLEPRLGEEVVVGPTGPEARRALDEVLAALIALFAEDPVDREAQFELREQLVALLRADPSLLERLSPELDRYADRQALANTILAAIGAVRSPEAQRFLADLVEDQGRAATLRLGATVSLFQTDRPTPEVWATALRAGEQSRDPAELRDSRLLLLGALSGREAEGADTAFARLVALEAQSERRGELPLWLDAVGNLRDRRVPALVARHLEADDATVREAALHGLTTAPGAEAEALLSRHLTSKAPVAERALALEALARRVGDPAGLVRGYRGSDEVALRRGLVLGLGARDDAAGRTALESLARQDPDEGLRELAAAQLR